MPPPAHGSDLVGMSPHGHLSDVVSLTPSDQGRAPHQR
jgi:hypothetical protein